MRWRFAALLLAIGLATTSGPARAKEAPSAGPTEDAAAIVRVRPVSDAIVHPQRQASASVTARNESRISAQIAAVIRSIGAFAGQAVEKGAVLARLDDTDIELALRQAIAQRDAIRARLDLAESQLARAKELKAREFVSVEVINQREAEARALRAELRATASGIAIARRNIEKTVLRAPFAGVVRERAAQVGELTAPGAPLFVLTQTGSPEVVAAVPADLADRLQDAPDPVFDDGRRRLPLKLLRVSPLASRETRTREARLSFVGEGLAPGFEGSLRWSDPRAFLPPALLVRRESGLGVFLVEAQRARFVLLPGAQEGRPALTDLPAAAQVVVEGQARLRDGQPVRIGLGQK
ncbi:MAG: efflux RND transporter periplasmic adaptor subunit [Burkholderiaceae bacterium]